MVRAPLLSAQDALKLAKLDSMRVFFIEALRLRTPASKRTNLAEFSRRAGFSSRSYISELLAGRKGLSRDALLRIQSTLKLPKPALRLFELLAYKEDPRLSIKKLNHETLNREIQVARIRLRSWAETANRRDVSPSLLGTPSLFQVYASLGTADEGATLEQIKSRSRLPIPTIEAALEIFLREKIISKKGTNFVPCAMHLDFLGLKKNQQLANLIHEVCADIQKNRQHISTDVNSLTVYSAFSIRQDRLPALKKSLQEAIFEVMDQYQDDRGDTVEQVFITLFRS